MSSSEPAKKALRCGSDARLQDHTSSHCKGGEPGDGPLQQWPLGNMLGSQKVDDAIEAAQQALDQLGLWEWVARIDGRSCIFADLKRGAFVAPPGWEAVLHCEAP